MNNTLDRINTRARRLKGREQHLQTALRLIEYAVQFCDLADGYTVCQAAMVESSAAYLLAGMRALGHYSEAAVIDIASMGTPVATDTDRLNALLKVSSWIQAGMQCLHTNHENAIVYFHDALAFLLVLADNHSEVFKRGEREAYFNAIEGVTPDEVNMRVREISLYLLNSVERNIRSGCLNDARIELYVLLRRFVAVGGFIGGFDAAMEHTIAYGLYDASALTGLDELEQAINAIADAHSCLTYNANNRKSTCRKRIAQALIHVCKAETNIEGGLQ